MKLYYAFSNIMLLIQANIQANVSDEEADLLVWSTVPIDYHLVEVIRKKEIFRNIWYLERPKILFGRKIKDKIKYRKYKKKFYFKYLEEIFSGQKYDEFITSGFWNDIPIIFQYLKKNNPNIKIGISEEGLLNYYCGCRHRNLYYMVQYTMKQNIRAYLNGGRLFRYVQKNIVADYLMAPDLMRQEIDNEIYSLPAIDEKNPIMKSIVDELFGIYQKKYGDVIDEYESRKIVYMHSPHNGAYDPVDIKADFYELIKNEIPLNQLVIKTHTNSTKARREFETEFDDEVFIDKNVYLFEVLFSHLCSSEKDKVFIVRNSSIAIYLTQMFKIEPTFIFIHRLYSRYHYGWDDCGDFYVEDLKRNMRHPERVLVPNSYVELKVILNKLCALDDTSTVQEKKLCVEFAVFLT